MKRRKHPQKSYRGRPRRAGTPYEDAVCDLFRQFFPKSTIRAGVWVEGPDGRRELDIDITEDTGERVIHGVVECKDFNPETTGPVGIAFLDALDSKRQDLRLDFAIVCSNAGFTADAIRKASRVKIGLLSASRINDKRIRFEVSDEIYTRHIRLLESRIRFWPADGTSDLTALAESGQATFGGKFVEAWFFSRFAGAILANPIVSGNCNIYCNFKRPIQLDWPRGSEFVKRIGLETKLEGAWFAQTVDIRTTAGLYDWMRRKMRMAPSEEPRQLQIAGINYHGGKWIACPPTVDWANKDRIPFEVDIRFVIFKTHFSLENPADLTPHVVPEDLNVVFTDMPPSAMQSTIGITPDPVV